MHQSVITSRTGSSSLPFYVTKIDPTFCHACSQFYWICSRHNLRMKYDEDIRLLLVQLTGYYQTIDSVLDNAFSKSGRVPDIVFNGHVHNYQRFTRNIKGRQVPYVVAGAGGYHNLHYMQKQPDGNSLQAPYVDPNNNDVTLENYCADHNGYMVLRATQDTISGEYYIVPKQNESWQAKSQKIDSFELDLKQHVLTKNTNPP